MLSNPASVTYWQVARAEVAAEPRATEAAAMKAMVTGRDGHGDGRRGNKMRVVVGVTDEREGGGRGVEFNTIGRGRTRVESKKRRVRGREVVRKKRCAFCVTEDRRTEVASDGPIRLPQDAVISAKMPPRPHIHRLRRLDPSRSLWT